jgi:cytoplasmic iron level regulating protein YaaA (DUF328/UPF0246 family)
MHISDKLGLRAKSSLENTFNKDNARPAIYTFDGDVYTGLDAYTIL